jgi:O-antigen ligase
MGIAGGVILSLIGKINLGLVFLIPIFPLRNILEKMQQYPFGKDYINVILVSMLLGWLFKQKVNNESKFRNTPANKTIIILIFWSVITYFIGTFYLQSHILLDVNLVRLKLLKNFITFPILYFIIVNNIKDKKQIKFLVIVMVLTMLIIDYYTCLQIRWMGGLASRSKINGTFVELGPNELGAFLAICTSVLSGILFFEKKSSKLRLLIALVIVLNLYCILFLYSRGTYLSVMTGLLFISIVKKRKLLAVFIVVVLFWQVFLPEKVVERIKQTRSEQGSLDQSSQSRLNMWQDALNLFKESPLTGVGYAVVPFYGLSESQNDPHNIYMKILAEEGIVGFIIILIFFFLCFRSGWKLYVTSTDRFLKGLGFGFSTAVIVTMVANLFGDRFSHLQIGGYYWAFFGLVAKGNLIVERKNESNAID